MKANISVCLICKNEEKNLEPCLLSLRDYVEEIVVVDTGSTDSSVSIAKKYADIVEVCTEFSDSDGNLANFASARNRAKDLATKDWMLWVDCDDEFVGADQLQDIINNSGDAEIKQILLPYEYSRDANGDVNCLHYRERLVYPKDKFNWVNPVHEVLLGPENVNTVFNNDVKVVHKRTEKGKKTDPYRNFRIIKKYVDEIGESDPRQLYYLGLEYGNILKFEEAIKTLSRYVELSGWDDEKCLAALKIAEHYATLNNIEEAIVWGCKALNIKPNWCEPYLFLGKMHYSVAKEKESKNQNAFSSWEHCVNFIKVGLSLPPTQTVLFINPKERDFEIHKYFNFALSKINDIDGAITSVSKALEKQYDKGLEDNLKCYKQFKANAIINDQLDYLKSNNLISQKQIEKIYQIMTNQDLKIEEFEPYKRSSNYPKDVKDEDFPVAKKSPHSQAWSIPESFVFDDLPLVMTDDQLKAMILAIYKEYMLHDEIISALSILEKAPYRIRDTDFIQSLIKKTKGFIAWIDSEEEYDRHNAAVDNAGDLLGREMTPIGFNLGTHAQMRMQWMEDRMPDKSKSILDLACIDGEFSNRWGLKGYKVTGVDCCSHSIKIANEAAEKHNTGAKHIQSYFNVMPEKINEKFDYISCGDVYEHLKDPVEDLLKPALKMVKDSGKMLLVTPSGAWFRGLFRAHAHPWLWALQGKHWLSEERRAHVIAPSVWSTLADFRKAGWYVHNCTHVDQWVQDVPDQGNVCVEAFPNKKLDKQSIVFYIGNGLEEWTPNTISTKGLGGSETAAIHMAKELVKLGHPVKVYASCGVKGEGVYEGVEYYTTDKYHDLSCDILICSRYPSGASDELNIKAKKKFIWTHDVYPLGLTKELYNKFDGIFVLSKWHKEFVLKQFDFVESNKLIITRNGLDLSHFDKVVERNQYKLICASSPDRYLPSLLSMWKDIKKEVPEATVNIFYGFYNWETAATLNNDQKQLQLIKELKQNIEEYKDLGVNFVGMINQQTLANEFLNSNAWVYPTWFSETSCIAAMSAIAAGCKIITSPIAALNETVGDLGEFVNGTWMEADYQESFKNAVVKALKNPISDRQRLALKEYAKANLSWSGIAQEWHKMFEDKKEVLPKKIEYVSALKKYVPIYEIA